MKNKVFFDIYWRDAIWQFQQPLSPNEKYASFYVPDLFYASFAKHGVSKYVMRVFFYQKKWISCFDHIRSKKELILDFYNLIVFHCEELEGFEISPICIDKIKKE